MNLKAMPVWLISLIIVVVGGTISWRVTVAQITSELRVSVKAVQERVGRLEDRPQVTEAVKEALGALRSAVAELKTDLREVRQSQIELLKVIRAQELDRGRD